MEGLTSFVKMTQ